MTFGAKIFSKSERGLVASQTFTDTVEPPDRFPATTHQCRQPCFEPAQNLAAGGTVSHGDCGRRGGNARRFDPADGAATRQSAPVFHASECESCRQSWPWPLPLARGSQQKQTARSVREAV